MRTVVDGITGEALSGPAYIFQGSGSKALKSSKEFYVISEYKAGVFFQANKNRVRIS